MCVCVWCVVWMLVWVTPCTPCWLSNIHSFSVIEFYETCYRDIIVLSLTSPPPLFLIAKKRRAWTIIFLSVGPLDFTHSWTYDSLSRLNVTLIIVININSKMWKKSRCERLRFAEIAARPSERRERVFRCALSCVPPSVDRILKIDRKKRKRRAIGTVYAFLFFFSAYGTIPHIILLRTYIYIYIHAHTHKYVCMHDVSRLI